MGGAQGPGPSPAWRVSRHSKGNYVGTGQTPQGRGGGESRLGDRCPAPNYSPGPDRRLPDVTGLFWVDGHRTAVSTSETTEG